METEAQISNMTVSGVESDLLPPGSLGLVLTMAFRALPEQTPPKAVAEKRGVTVGGMVSSSH